MVRKTGEALRWIVGILRKRKVPFQISGGLAAIIHGAKRQLNDIDIDAPDARMKDILPDVRKYIVFGPKRLVKEGFDIYLLTLKYKGEMIDIGGCDACKLFDSKMKRWVTDNSDLSKAVRKEVFGRIIPVTPKEELIRYKRRLERDTDLIDIRELGG
jgi:hypothetical protein